MKQRAQVLIEFPEKEGMHATWLKETLENMGSKVEIQSVFLQLKGIKVPKEFRFKNEKQT